MIRIGSMFAGIGGFELGVEYALRRHGYPCETVWQIEQDQYCQRILHKHWPHAEIFDDVRECGAHNLSPCDVLLAGFPCTDISTAGKKTGLEGKRSGLFREVIRTAREMEPRIIALENVPNVYHLGLETILWKLAEIGYSARWSNLSAHGMDHRIPHRRHRWFCVAWRPGSMAHSSGGGFTLRRPKSERQNTGAPDQEHGGKQPHTSGVAGGFHGLPSRVDLSAHRWPAPPGQPPHSWEPPRTRARQPHDRQRIKALGNSIIPQCAAEIGAWIAEELLQ